MIQIFGKTGERMALDLSSIRGIVENPEVQYVYLHGDKEPYAVTESFDFMVEAWRKHHHCVCGA